MEEIYAWAVALPILGLILSGIESILNQIFSK